MKLTHVREVTSRERADAGAESTMRSEDPPNHEKNALERFSETICRAAGSSYAFGIACLVVFAWAVTGPAFAYSDTWQLVINTGTTIVTFLMVFLIQRSQNKDSLAVQLKLNEVVAAINGASNRLIDVEALSESDLNTLRQHYARLVDLADNDGDLTESHSIEDAHERHERKLAHNRAGTGALPQKGWA